MEEMVTARDFRLKFREICTKILQGKSLIVVRRSRPIFRVEPIEESPSDLLNRTSSDPEQGPPMEEIADMVHAIRRKIK